ncbi:electron transfer flavoprotein subunit alpha/FixB family protein [Desulfosporosinus fructosivorans]|uniref:Electron transfer flavoprotein subunit alpha/FixB family protein n=1 Tax=Desulfosporosinus fructosivorans TaxID=2018669 RepID=A0A4Z0QX37_9FIRM|nr:electron transfer flavoprotein subunit alpha/FixB family protein [Desulfosporosinus fructosivorans]TGE35352.1 electron transfer flavoprotein subunit alpha/FixB family protein [Desulfosporosinus fructosivorans]
MAIYIYSDRKSLAAELVAFAKQEGKESVILAMGTPAEDFQGCGADKILEIGSGPAENYSKALADYLKKHTMELLLAGATLRGRDVAARVAGYMKAPLCADVHSIIGDAGDYIIERMMYGGAVNSRQKLPSGGVATVSSGCFEATSGQSVVETISLKEDLRVQLLSCEPVVRSGEDLSNATRVVSVGQGLKQQEDLALIRQLADAMGAALACSRGVAEERRWLPVEKYVGISGNILSPSVYLACGISGQIQHIYGVRDAKIIVGINNNEQAPIFAASDYGIVGDLYEVVPALIAELQRSL